MNYVFILPDLSIGGAQRVLLTYARLFSVNDNVLLVTISSHGGLRSELLDGVELVSFSQRKLNLLLQISFLLWLPFFLVRRRVDVTFSTLFQLNIFLGILRKLRIMRTKLVIREANFVSVEWPKSRAYFIFKLLGGIAYRSSDAVVCLNVDQMLDVRVTLRVDQEKLHIVPNPVIGLMMRSIVNDKSSNVLPFERPILLSVGRLEKQKRLDLLLISFFKFRVLHGRGSLVVVGKGSREFDLKALIAGSGMADYVHFLGEWQNPYPAFKEADLYILTSDFEGLPNTLIQGCYLTQRVVSTDCRSGPSSILSDYEGGMLVKTGDIEGLVNAYSVMLGRPKVAPSDSWIYRYSEDSSFQQLQNIFKCVVS